MDRALHVEDISKSYPGVLAVDSVSFSLSSGEVLAIVGENGAGKSTLTQIISGARRPDSGRIHIDDKAVEFTSVHDAILSGIAMVFQELSLSGNLSVAENVFTHRQPVGRLGLIRWRELYARTQELLDRFSLDFSPDTLLRRLSIGEQQIVEILKGVSTNPKVLILDEPTSSLTDHETTLLFDILRALTDQGIAIIYISHKLSEVFDIAGRVLVMRDGKKVGERQVGEVTEEELVAMMVGRHIEDLYGRPRDAGRGKAYFSVQGFSRAGAFEDVGLELHRGEILGLAGLVGAGRTEIVRAIFGIDPKDSGTVQLNGKELHISRPEDAIKAGIAYLTEDRKADGLFVALTLRDNIVAPALDSFTSTLGMMQGRAIDRYARGVIDRHSIVARNHYQLVETLSGGNQQKLLLAMWMGLDPEVLIVDEPTRGVDVGARKQIYDKLREFAASDRGVLMISSDLPELIGLCDRIIVMHAGRITGSLLREDFTEEQIVTYAAGIGNRETQNV